MTSATDFGPENRPPWHPWRDDNGNLHWNVPRCEKYTQGRGWLNKHGHPCRRKGIRKRVDAPGWKGEHWFCTTHDPGKAKPEDLQVEVRELRAALAAVLPAARYGVRAAEPMAVQLGAREWRRAVHRGEDLVEGK